MLQGEVFKLSGKNRAVGAAYTAELSCHLFRGAAAPPLYDDPYIFELEANEEEWAVHKGDKADSENYITFPRFAYCIDVKLFGEEHSIVRKFVDTFMVNSGAEPYAPGKTGWK